MWRRLSAVDSNYLYFKNMLSTTESLSDNRKKRTNYVSQSLRTLRHTPKIQVHATECGDSVAPLKLDFVSSQTDYFAGMTMRDSPFFSRTADYCS